MKTLTIPENIQQYINQYLQLNFEGVTTNIPYFINITKNKDLRVLMGKGSPKEIEMEVKLWAKLKKVDLKNLTSLEIKQFITSLNIGIDCSGFVMHILNFWYKSINKKDIWSKLIYPKKGLYNQISYKLRPIEKLGAELITSNINSDVVDLKDVRPGDLIRSKWTRQNAHHVMLVTKVTIDNNIVKEIEYTHSTPFYDKNSGVKTGIIKIIDQNRLLEDQEWLETNVDGINFTYEGFLIQKEDNGLRRLKVMK